MGTDMETVEDVVGQMKLLLGAIPPRPSAAAVEEARQAIREEERALTAKLGELFAQSCAPGVPAAAFRALQELHEGVMRTQSEVRRRDDAFVLQLEDRHRVFGDLLRKAELASPPAGPPPPPPPPPGSPELRAAEDGAPPGLQRSSSDPPAAGAPTGVAAKKSDQQAPAAVVVGGGRGGGGGELRAGLAARTREEGRSLVAGLQQRRAIGEDAGLVGGWYPRAGAQQQNQQNVEGAANLTASQEELLEVKWPPELLSILEAAEAEGKQPQSLNFSSGGYNWLPDSVGLLTSLTSLNLSCNRLTALPDTLGALSSLTDLDLEANALVTLPNSLGDLVSLKRLNIEKNCVEEIPWTIGGCTSLEELRADFNELKALPEAMGQLRRLKVLSVHLNSLKTLPTTIASLTSLTDLFVHFNHLETLPESLCTLSGLVRLDASSNFAEFRHLPSQIGNLQGLRELDLSFNHITVLPDSFAELTNLRKLNLDGNPWRTPPLDVVAQGKGAVFEYMDNWRNRERETAKKSPSWNVLAIVAGFISKCRKPNAAEANDPFAKITA